MQSEKKLRVYTASEAKGLSAFSNDCYHILCICCLVPFTNGSLQMIQFERHQSILELSLFLIPIDKCIRKQKWLLFGTYM